MAKAPAKKAPAKKAPALNPHKNALNIYEKSWRIFYGGETGWSKKLSTINYIMERALKEGICFYMETKMQDGDMHFYITRLMNLKETEGK